MTSQLTREWTPGQSATEVTAFLHQRFLRAEVCAVLSRVGYSPSDDSPFANQVFDPSAVDQFYLYANSLSHDYAVRAARSA